MMMMRGGHGCSRGCREQYEHERDGEVLSQAAQIPR
jgi:hypothetical protein